MRLVSDAFANGQPIPERFTEDGENLSPPLSWGQVPTETKQFAVVCEDPDAPTPKPWVHWVIWGISAETHGLPEGVPPEPVTQTPVSARQGGNSFPSGQTVGYRGPAPPPGHGLHHYHFRLYALDAEPHLEPRSHVTAFRKAIEGHVLDEAELVGTYERPAADGGGR